jgi:hypothetical protein
MIMKIAAVSGAIAGSLLCASAASADTVTIGLQTASVNGGAVTAQPGAGPTASISTVGYGGFTVSASGFGQSALVPPALLFSGTVNVAQSALSAGTVLNIFVTDQGITTPTGLVGFLSGFTVNTLSAGWTVLETTLVSSTNALFAGTTLSSAMFNSSDVPGGATGLNSASVTGPYSVTEEYTITSSASAGGSTDTMQLSTTPLPATLPLFATGLGALGFGAWRKRKKQLGGLASVACA